MEGGIRPENQKKAGQDENARPEISGLRRRNFFADSHLTLVYHTGMMKEMKSRFPHDKSKCMNRKEKTMKRNLTGKFLYLTAALILSLVMLVGCGGSEDSTDEDNVSEETTEYADNSTEDETEDQDDSEDETGESPVIIDDDEVVYVLPDLGASVFSAGELIKDDYELNGVTYAVYEYSWEKDDYTSLASEVRPYEWQVEAAGFGFEKDEDLSEGNGVTESEYWYLITCDAGTAYLCLTGSYYSTTCDAWLYVPETVSFTLEDDVEYNVNYFLDVDIVDSDDDDDDATAMEYYYLTCEACDGTGLCGTCGGDGWYTNSYNGHQLECSSCKSTDGACSVCDGTGVWGPYYY